MLLRIDRVMLRVPNVEAAAKYYCDVLGMKIARQQKDRASLKFAEGQSELLLHNDEALPSGEVYYLVENVRDLFERKAELKLQFTQKPQQAGKGYRATIRDPYGNTMILIDRTSAGGEAALEDGKTPGALFAGVAEKVEVKRDVLVKVYEEIGRTADDLPYTPEFVKLHTAYAAKFHDNKPTLAETWRQLLNLRKAGKLPKLGEARSKAPDVEDQERAKLRELLGEDIGKRDRLPYTERFDKLVDELNKGRPRDKLSPHLVWRLVATLAK
jgi:catechol 2,3-dioxygenase-like lactoylglutathione lyase family enzyme